MASLIGQLVKAGGTSGGPPVALSADGLRRLSPLGPDSNRDEQLMRAYNTQGTVHANVSVIAVNVAATPWSLFRQPKVDGRVRYSTASQGSDQREEVIRHPAINLLNNPATVMMDGQQVTFWSRADLMELGQIWLETCGKSFWVVERAPGSTMPIGLWPVRPDRMIPVPSREHYLHGWMYQSPDGGEKVPLNPTDVIFVRRPNPLDMFGGSGPIGAVLTDVEAARYAAEWNRNFFNNSALPGGVIQVENSLTDPEWQALQDRWRETHRGVARAHRVAVLENGATWVPNSHSMKDMDFGNLRTSSRDIIREAMAMHKVMTGVTDDVNRANAQTGEEVFSSWTVQPRLDRWKNAFDTQLLPMFGPVTTEFDYWLQVPQNRELDNAEIVAKTSSAVALVGAGWHWDDVLKEVGLPSMRWVGPPAGAPSRPPVAKQIPGADEKPGQVGDDHPSQNALQPFDAWRELEALAAPGALNRAGAR